MKNLFILFVALTPIFAKAQRLQTDIYAGVANYQGDLQIKRVSLEAAKPAFGVGLTYNISNHFGIRTAFTYASVQGSDAKTTKSKGLGERNLSFGSKIFEGQLAVEYNILNLNEHFISPYVVGGAAIFGFNPFAYDASGNKVFLQPLGTEGQGLPQYTKKTPYKKIDKALIFGGGLKFALSQNVQIGVEVTVRKTFTDYLDDVSGTYADSTILATAKGVKATDFAYRGKAVTGLNYPTAGAQRGNLASKDFYYFTVIKASFLLGNGTGSGGNKKGLGCPRNVM